MKQAFIIISVSLLFASCGYEIKEKKSSEALRVDSLERKVLALEDSIRKFSNEEKEYDTKFRKEVEEGFKMLGKEIVKLKSR